MYCGTSLVVKEVLSKTQANGPDASKLVELGNVSLAADRHEEAYNYFTRAIEADSSLPSAWYGKAESSYGMATLKDIRDKEIILCCEKYVELSGGSTDSAEKASSLLTSAASGIAAASFNHFVEYGGTYIGVHGSMAVTKEVESQEWVARIFTSLIMHEKAVYIAEKSSINIKKHLVSYLETLAVFVDNAFLVKSINCDPSATNLKRVSNTHRNVLLRGVEDSVRNKLLAAYDNNRIKLLTVDDSYSNKFKSIDEIIKAENDKASSSGLCFVATACYGSDSDESVIVLREFRDKVLRKNLMGKAFIRLYYRYGAYAAEYIQGRYFLLIFTRKFICDPAALLARAILKFTK
jgi:tetratricopeptide (TPR) repeat protein